MAPQRLIRRRNRLLKSGHAKGNSGIITEASLARFLAQRTKASAAIRIVPYDIRVFDLGKMPVTDNPLRLKKQERARGYLLALTFKGLKRLIKLNPGVMIADAAGKGKRIGRIAKADKGRVHILWTEDEAHGCTRQPFEPYETDHSISELVKAKVSIIMLPKAKKPSK